MSPMILVKKLRPDAQIPTYGSEFAIGLDLYATEDAIIAPGVATVVPTGIAIAIPATHYARIAPRSGLAAKHGVDVLAGVVDADYRGEVKVLLTTHTEAGVHLKAGDRIAQLILERADRMPVYEVGLLPPTLRAANGFGSTG